MARIVVISGASRGLGIQMAKRYLELGDTVYAGARNPECSQLRELKEEYPEKLVCVAMDVTSTPSVNTAAAQVAEKSAYVDILVNNAATHSGPPDDILEMVDIDSCRRIYDVNCLGSLRTVKALLPLLRAAKGAKIANISSEAGSIGACWRTAGFDYCMSKSGMNMGTKLLSNYLKDDGVHVISIHPGWLRTDMGGPKADLDPYEAAATLVDLIESSNLGDSELFLNYTGEELPW